MKSLLKVSIISSLFLLTSCEKSNNTWENVKTAGRYFQKSFDSLMGKEYNSEWVQNQNEFIGPDEEFIPLSDKDLKKAYGDNAVPQPKKSPGDFGSGIPGFSNFKNPNNSIFSLVHFDTDDHILRNKEDLLAIQKIASYLIRNPNVYVCIEGHTDERASAAYNMALGTRRANHIRVLLIKQGIDFNRLYTVSKGKETPIALGHSSNDWKVNRRGEFKIYEKK